MDKQEYFLLYCFILFLFVSHFNHFVQLKCVASCFIIDLMPISCILPHTHTHTHMYIYIYIYIYIHTHAHIVKYVIVLKHVIKLRHIFHHCINLQYDLNLNLLNFCYLGIIAF